MDEDSKALWQRIDEHTKEIAASVMEIGLIKAQLKRIEGDHSYICQTLKKTEDRLVIMIEAIVASINEIKLQNAERTGSIAATKQSINWGFELLKIAITALPICAAIIVSYPHK